MEVETSSVLLYLAIFLAVAKLGAVVAAKIRQPGVFGELIAGIMIGPFVAGKLSQQLFGTALFIDPTSPAGEFMSVFADIGIILLLFLAGLSIDIEDFKKSEKAATIVAILGVVVAFLFGFGIAIFFGWDITKAAFVGAVLTATSVGITVRSLMTIHILHTRVGMTILGAAVIDDVIAIIILSVLASFAFGGLSFLGLAGNLALITFFFVLVIYIGFKTFHHILTFVGKLHVEEVTLSIALALVFLIGALAEKVQIAAITGAFIAGLIMSRAPVAGSLRTKVSTMGYGLFIPLFFVEMGVRTDLQELAGVGAVLALVLVGAAIISKIVGCGGGALASGFGGKDSLRVGIGMIPRAEVALVIAAIGFKTGIIGPELLSITVLIVLVTTLITPLLIQQAFKGIPRKKK